MKKAIMASELFEGDMVYSGKTCLFVKSVIDVDDRHVSVNYRNGGSDLLAKVARVEIHIDEEDDQDTDYEDDEE
jgi:hypothetical protein